MDSSFSTGLEKSLITGLIVMMALAAVFAVGVEHLVIWMAHHIGIVWR